MFDPQVNNVSKMAGPIGPPGHNGSQGPKGAGNFSSCQYKVVKDVDSPGGPVSALVGQTEPDVSMVNVSLRKIMTSVSHK